MEKDKVEKVKERLTGTQLILMALMSNPGNCITIDELVQKTGLKRERIILYLHRLHKRGIITRHWRHLKSGKVREYCLKYKEQLLS